ncbi:MAG: FAD binding domain-containing protein, partial [Polyangiales bacterium]
MLRLHPFALEQPTTVEEAVARLHKHGDRARAIAGGTDLLPNAKLGTAKPSVLVSLRNIR